MLDLDRGRTIFAVRMTVSAAQLGLESRARVLAT